MIRRFLSIIFILALLAGVALVVYAYISELPAPVRAVETPAAGVGFADQ
ncbi:MAG: hypothetical protein AAF401_11440 [Pseudomonadota bacterium]